MPNRRLKRAAFTFFLLGGLVLLMGQANPGGVARVVEAERFVLRDATGKVRAELGLRDGRPGLALFDEKGERRAQLAMLPDGSSSLTFYDRDGNARAVVRVGPEGDPHLDLREADGKVRAGALDVSPDLAAQTAVAPAVRERNGRLRAAEGLYRRFCLRCHEADGRGTQTRPRMPTLPDFADATWHSSRTDAQLVAGILNGRGQNMPAFEDRLSAEQARDLVAFIRSFGPAPVRPAEAVVGDFEKRLRQLQRQWDELQRQMHELRGP